MSRPLRARGLKHILIRQLTFQKIVAPPAGAWIETISTQPRNDILRVAPPAGAWIETYTRLIFCPFALVAPPAGAWIEI